MSQQKKHTEQTAVPVQKKQPVQTQEIEGVQSEQLTSLATPTTSGILDIPDVGIKPLQQAQVLRMQKQHGNKYVQRFLQNRAEPAPKPRPSIPSLPKINYPIQAKLSVNEPNDAYEQEADAMADAVMRMSISTQSGTNENKTPSVTQVQRKGDGVGGQDVSADVESKIASVQSSGGKPLPDSERDFFEPRMGVDLSDVRVHDGETAVQTARDLNAKAYTVGSDIVFNKGEYAPGSDSGRKLMAHELTHVLQQTGSVDRQIQRDPIEVDGGEWDTDTYDNVSNGGKEVGVDIDLKFTPKSPTDATQIGLTQMVNSIDEGEPIALNDTVAGRSIPEGEAEAGQHIDQLAQFPNPMYATGAANDGDSLADTPTQVQWGQHGWRYTDESGLQTQDGHLKDTPQLPNRGKNAKQIFESTALALEGNQVGTYYGSIQWGWETDNEGNFSRLPLSLVSKGNPTEVFMRAAQLWNQGQTSDGKETIDLPTTYNAGEATNLSTQELIETLKQAKEDLAKLTDVPATTNKDFEVRQLENELRRRHIQITVNTVSASGDNMFAGKDDVYVKATYNGQTATTDEHGMDDGDSHDFQISLANLLPPTPMPTDFIFDGSISIEVLDSDSWFTGGDDSMTSFCWDAPFDTKDHDGGDYKVKVQFE